MTTQTVIAPAVSSAPSKTSSKVDANKVPLTERAMLASLTIRQWSARKHDKQASAEVNDNHQAARDAGRYNKRLLSKDALQFVQSTASAARTEHYKRTLPWSDEGARILSVAGYFDYAKAIKDIKQDFLAEVEKFADNYPQHRENAKRQLGSLFRDEDYPDPSMIADKFNIELHVFPMPSGDDFRANLPRDQLASIRADIENEVRASLDAGMIDVYQRIHGVLDNMVTKLRDYKPSGTGQKTQGIFRNSLVTNVGELVGLIPSLNVTGDPALAQICEEMRTLTEHDANELREYDGLRTSTADKAASILERVNEFIA